MSERTTIGGTVYEAIGSSSSNLLLKCNGTARIQWGGKLIDLIKNGKIASGDSLELIFIIRDESEMKSDGIYVLTTEESDQLLVLKDGNKYNFTNTDLYISASKELNLTVEQKKQALNNIGMYYDTLTEVQSAGIKNGIVYVTENKTLYTIKDGVVEEFEAKLKTVTVEKESDDNGEVINSAVKIVLSILDEEYLVLADQRIIANYSIHVNNSVQIGSENADKTKGYRLYIDGDTSYLDVDKINVRKGIENTQYKKVTFDELVNLKEHKALVANEWYLITNFLNHWRLVVDNDQFNRPILIRALNEFSFYEKSYLFKDNRIEIHYDIDYLEPIKLQKSNGTEEVITTRGKITWMKDLYGNEANFDFLDYKNASNEELTLLHYSSGDTTLDKSIFPKNSYNNKLIVYNLKGTVLKDLIIDNSVVNTIEFQFDDTKELEMEMHDNVIECKNLTITPTCTKFTNNNIKQAIKLEISNEFSGNEFQSIYNKTDYTDSEFKDVLDTNTFNKVLFLHKTCNFKGNIIKHSIFNNEISDVTVENLEKVTIESTLKNVSLKNLTECTFDVGTIEYVSSYYDFTNVIFNNSTYPMLYVPEKRKEIHIQTIQETPIIKIICIPEAIFYRGMIIMHSGIEPIPNGWAICDGNEYTFNGVTSKTPNLINRFIKAVETVEEIKETNNDDMNENGEITLTTDHLPVHSHPHLEHTHTFSSSGTAYDSFNAVTSADEGTVITAIEGGTEGKALTKVNTSKIEVLDNAISISGSTSSVTSTESGWLYRETPKPLKMIPNYYSLIFIMKL